MGVKIWVIVVALSRGSGVLLLILLSARDWTDFWRIIGGVLCSKYNEVIHFPICHSDHVAILLKFNTQCPYRNRGKLFWFKSLWLSNEECGAAVAEAWLVGDGSPIHSRLETVAGRLNSWAANTFGVVKKRIKQAVLG